MTETSGPTLRPSPLDRLFQLDRNQEISADEMRTYARELGVSERTLGQWLAARRAAETPVAPNRAPEPGTRQMGYRDAGRRPRVPVSVTAGDHLLSRIPDSDVATFRADAYRRLSPSEFARVDAVYTAGLEATCRWLNARSGLPCRHDLDRRADPVWFGRDEVARAEYARSVLRPRPAARSVLPGGSGAGSVDEWIDILGLYRFLGGFVAGSPGRGNTVVRLRGAQAAFLLHGMRLDLPPDLNYSVGPGLTTVRLDSRTVEQIRAGAPDPVAAAALATVLFTGATMVELGAVPRVGLMGDALIFTGPIGYARAADVYVWVIPRVAQDLLHEADLHREAHGDRGPRLFAGALGAAGRRLRDTAARCGLALPATRHWNHSWIRRTGLLRGLEAPEYVRNSDLLFGLRFIPSPGPPPEG
ncbi:hypothetical protein [Nocardia carnea]|uniref:hypothetical protein n=1 Tax=Nocardia carnea TaxID=37328 RepID=UPI0024575F4C|nr:hypothetical protein [Nocardia carnea]